MTTELKKTLGFVLIALILTGAAYVKIPDRTSGSEAFNDQGKKFFPEFTDPFACTDLEVAEFDDATAKPREFKVTFKNGKWTIPSHHNYPADAKDRLAKTAGGVMDLNKDTIRSDRSEDHESLGVLDPLDLKAGLKGLGKRVTLRDKSDKVLADFIIGNEVRERSGMRYVRVPGQKRTYGVNVNAELSTRFADWVETNLLKLDASHLRSVTFDNSKADPDRERIVPGILTKIEKKDASAQWSFDGTLPADQELNTEKISSLTSALADLKIVGVRPKPAGLSRELKMVASNEVKPATKSEMQSLFGKGFYPLNDGKLYSNQGEVLVRTDEGAVYTLRFGEALFASNEELTAGGDSEGKDKAPESKKTEGNRSAENRYLMVTVAFDPTLVPELPKPPEVLTIPEDPFWKAPDDPKRIAEEKASKEKLENEKAMRDKQLAAAEAKIKTLTERFADWYYVTPGESFRSIALERPALLRPKGGEEAPGGPPTSFPGFPGGAGTPRIPGRGQFSPH